jgi:D-glycero-alpha-D-manno-heptose-7-phosphate kinase
MILANAPVRVSFGGGGTDLATYYSSFGGLVINAAIRRYCTVLVREPMDGRTRISSADYRISQSFALGVVPEVCEPLALPKAVLEWYMSRGLCSSGIELVLRADVPPGTGLGSSSAMTVALIHALAAYTGMPIDAARAADLASIIEIERLGMPIGKQDHYASAFGGLNTITFTSEGVTVEPLRLPPDLRAALDARLLLFATGKRHDSAAILSQQRQDSAEKPVVIESLHQIKQLALEMRTALLAGELDQFGRLLDQSWHAKRRLSDKVSSPAIDCWYAAARAAGALGGKIAGAGGGGFLLLYCPPSRQAGLRATMTRLGLNELPFTFEMSGACALSQEEAARSASLQQAHKAGVALPIYQ